MQIYSVMLEPREKSHVEMPFRKLAIDSHLFAISYISRKFIIFSKFYFEKKHRFQSVFKTLIKVFYREQHARKLSAAVLQKFHRSVYWEISYDSWSSTCAECHLCKLTQFLVSSTSGSMGGLSKISLDPKRESSKQDVVF